MKKNSSGLKTAAAIVAALALVGLSAPRASWGLAPAATDPVAENLSRALQFQTISFQDASAVDAGAFLAFHAFLEKTFPRIHQRLTREPVGDLGLLYTWTGTDPAAKPIVLLAHIDVVPIAPGTLQNWTYPPFEGRIADGFIWGRGSMDCKGFLMAIMESVEGLLAEGYSPRRTVYLCFGQDEEVGGRLGAAKIAALLKSRGVTAELVVDEGGMIVDGKVLGIAKPLAMVGIAEKGYLSLELTVKTAGGHSSMPPRETAIGILSAAIARLQAHPFPAKIGGVTAITLERLATQMPSALGFALKNRWLFGPVIEKELAKNAATDAMIRTTTAPTIIAAGAKDNVLPQEARAVVNFRLLPGDRVADVIARTNKIIDDHRVTVAPIGVANEASAISRIDSPGFKILERTIGDLFPETVIAPFLVLGGTDARNYESISDSVFRFVPMRIGPEDQERAHGANERIGVANYHEIIAFYARLIRNSD